MIDNNITITRPICPSDGFMANAANRITVNFYSASAQPRCPVLAMTTVSVRLSVRASVTP